MGIRVCNCLSKIAWIDLSIEYWVTSAKWAKRTFFKAYDTTDCLTISIVESQTRIALTSLSLLLSLSIERFRDIYIKVTIWANTFNFTQSLNKPNTVWHESWLNSTLKHSKMWLSSTTEFLSVKRSSTLWLWLIGSFCSNYYFFLFFFNPLMLHLFTVNFRHVFINDGRICSAQSCASTLCTSQ